MITFILAVVAATVISSIVISAQEGVVHTWARRLVLILLNLSPWTIGTWRIQFSKRETFLASWLLFFSSGARSLLNAAKHFFIGEVMAKPSNPALNLAPFGRWTALKHRRLALR
jgi:hypothetical protein